MQKANEFKQWLVNDIGWPANQANNYVKRIQGIEDNLEALGLPFSSLEESWSENKFSSLYEELKRLRIDAINGGQGYRILWGESKSAQQAGNNMTSSKSYLTKYSQFLKLIESSSGGENSSDIENIAFDDDVESSSENTAKNIIYFGPPGTGKTYKLSTKLREYESGTDERHEFITFHQSYSYEEFVEGIRPQVEEEGVDSGEVSYKLNKGVFREICDRARTDKSGNRYALFIDEINRGNISKIFGELITLIEEDKREGVNNRFPPVRLPYSGDSFSVPQNLDIYGTMNTADRSLAHIDTALRRRFTFVELMPRPDLLGKVTMKHVEIDMKKMLKAMNERIETIFDREHTIGHAYFMGGDGKTVAGDKIPKIFQYKIIPLLTEYFFDDWSKVRFVLADDRYDQANLQFVTETEVDNKLISKNSMQLIKKVYKLNAVALKTPGAYVKIYEQRPSGVD